MVAARQVVEQKAQLPGGALGGSFSASEPSAGKHVEALADCREEAEVMALGFNLSEEGAALGGAQHVKEGVLGQAQPTDRAAPVVVHGTEGRPCPSKLVQRLNEAPNGPSPPK